MAIKNVKMHLIYYTTLLLGQKSFFIRVVSLFKKIREVFTFLSSCVAYGTKILTAALFEKSDPVLVQKVRLICIFLNSRILGNRISVVFHL